MPSKKKPIIPKLCMLVDHGGNGRWEFLEIVDSWDAKNTIRAFLKGKNVDGIMHLFKKS